MFVPREGNAPSLTPSLLLIALFVSFPWPWYRFLRYHKNHWRESNPLMCELKQCFFHPFTAFMMCKMLTNCFTVTVVRSLFSERR